MRTYVERAQDFIQQIYPFIEKDMFHPIKIGAPINQFNKQFSRKVKYYYGCARIALLTSDYVVKYDFDEDEVACLGGCENEVARYALAKREGFAHLFAEITPYEYQNHTFYIMPRIYGIERNPEYKGWHYMTYEERQWCLNHEITDLHCGNYGFRNGHICIIDYACYGYDDGESRSSDYEE